MDGDADSRRPRHSRAVCPAKLLWPVELNSVRLPLYQLRLLEELAARAGVSIDEFIFESLLHLETALDAADIERLMPGFRDAMELPSV